MSSKKNEQASSTIKSFFRPILAAIAIVFIAINYDSLKTSYRLFVSSRAVGQFGVDKCTIVGVSEGVEACEDIVIHHKSGYAFLACGNFTTRMTRWFPPIAVNTEGPIPRDQAFVYNINTGVVKPLKLVDYPDGDFILHGLGIYDDPSNPQNPTLFYINHKRSGSVIEIFEHKIGTDELKHVRTVSNELIRLPNNLLPISKDEFYITNNNPYKSKLGEYFQSLLRLPHANVLFHSVATNTTKIVADRIRFANGIASNRDLSRVYVAASFEPAIVVYDRKSDNRLVEIEKIPIDYMPDNLSVDEITGELYYAGFPNAIELMKYVESKGTTKRPSTIVVKISDNMNEDRFYGKKYAEEVVLEDSGEIFTILTIAAVDHARNTLLLGSLFAQGIGVCKLN